MTRESRARALAFATAVLVVLLAALFAALRNLTPAPKPAAPAAETSAAVTAGRAAFVELGCAGCHSAEGRGNRALPLDGVGARLDREELRAAAFGTAAGLPAGVAGIKRAKAGGMGEGAVVDFLGELK